MSCVIPHMAYGNQKVNRNDPCITRAVRAPLTCPKRGLTCLPLASKRAVVSMPDHWVWLKALYTSQRNCRRRDSLLRGIFLKSEKSQLCVPGLRKTSFGAFPKSPRAGRANAAGLIHCTKPVGATVCWLSERFGL